MQKLPGTCSSKNVKNKTEAGICPALLRSSAIFFVKYLPALNIYDATTRLEYPSASRMTRGWPVFARSRRWGGRIHAKILITWMNSVSHLITDSHRRDINVCSKKDSLL